MADKVVINDVGPRDGLQNQAVSLTPAERVTIIDALLAAGVSHVEVGSFVSPKAVPAMLGTDTVLKSLRGRQGEFSVLIPNMKGYEMAVAAGARCVAMVLYGTDGMANANVNMSRADAEQAMQHILQRAAVDGVRVLATIAVSWECPFDGPVAMTTVADIAGRFMALGADQIVLADSIGAANPQQVRDLTTILVNEHGAQNLACHFHDTRAMGLANVFAALESGIRSFDASIGGLGGCPFAPGASGNVATEDVVMMLEQMGCDTGIDLRQLMKASELAGNLTHNAPGGRAKRWLVGHLDKQDKVRVHVHG